jgi:hypothetical protein
MRHGRPFRTAGLADGNRGQHRHRADQRQTYR